MDKFEKKIDKLIEDNEFIKKEIGVLTANVRSMNTTLENLAINTSCEFETVRGEIKESKEEVLATLRSEIKSEIKNAKDELLEKLATKEVIADHETRILKLEHQEA